MRYQHGPIEEKWRAYWDANQTFATATNRTLPKYYVLDMFPYPSGWVCTSGIPKDTSPPTWWLGRDG
jgi:leucyl-tRNA synthetase